MQTARTRPRSFHPPKRELNTSLHATPLAASSSQLQLQPRIAQSLDRHSNFSSAVLHASLRRYRSVTQAHHVAQRAHTPSRREPSSFPQLRLHRQRQQSQTRHPPTILSARWRSAEQWTSKCTKAGWLQENALWSRNT